MVQRAASTSIVMISDIHTPRCIDLSQSEEYLLDGKLNSGVKKENIEDAGDSYLSRIDGRRMNK